MAAGAWYVGLLAVLAVLVIQSDVVDGQYTGWVELDVSLVYLK